MLSADATPDRQQGWLLHNLHAPPALWELALPAIGRRAAVNLHAAAVRQIASEASAYKVRAKLRTTDSSSNSSKAPAVSPVVPPRRLIIR